MPLGDACRALLDPCEETFMIDSGREALRLFLRRLPASEGTRRGKVLYLHDATFPSPLSVAFHFSGRSWRDALCKAGFDVWALDFLGFGGSDRYPEMDASGDANPPLGLAADAVTQVEAATRFIFDNDGATRLSLITHSWGSMPAGLFAAKHPTQVDRIVMFAPLACREGPRYTPRPRRRPGSSEVTSHFFEYGPYLLGANDRINFKGEQFPYTPHFSAQFGARYDWDLTDRFVAFVSADGSYQTRSYAVFGYEEAQADNAPPFTINSYALLNLTAGLSPRNYGARTSPTNTIGLR